MHAARAGAARSLRTACDAALDGERRSRARGSGWSSAGSSPASRTTSRPAGAGPAPVFSRDALDQLLHPQPRAERVVPSLRRRRLATPLPELRYADLLGAGAGGGRAPRPRRSRAARGDRATADRLLAMQLPDGGWPWLFDAERGTVVERYEIYSVHQDAMAPMALARALGGRAATGATSTRSRGAWLGSMAATSWASTWSIVSNGLVLRSIRRKRGHDRFWLAAKTGGIARRPLDARLDRTADRDQPDRPPLPLRLGARGVVRTRGHSRRRRRGRGRAERAIGGAIAATLRPRSARPPAAARLRLVAPADGRRGRRGVQQPRHVARVRRAVDAPALGGRDCRRQRVARTTPLGSSRTSRSASSARRATAASPMAATSVWPAGRRSSCCSSIRTPRSTRQASRCSSMRCARIRGSQASARASSTRSGSVLFTQRRFPRLRSTYAQGLFLHRAAPLAAWTDDAIRDPDAYERRGTPEWISGCCVLLRREAVASVGGLDEGFFLYAEETDLFKRLADAGWRAGFEPRATARHDGYGSARPERDGAHPRSQSRPLCPQTPRPCGRRVRGRRAGPGRAHARRGVGPSSRPGSRTRRRRSRRPPRRPLDRSHPDERADVRHRYAGTQRARQPAAPR